MTETAFKVALAVLTLLLMASMGGGFLLLPLLVPLHIWAARTSGPVGKVVWSLLPGASAGMVVWAAVYMTLGETQPFIWLSPTVSAVAAVIVAVRASDRPRTLSHA
ncbi:MAG TPA: hypothetical protein VM142_08710 [Acidimicrobiales bacterium]|nr:hypothetical protein [Acidimicrobiales bacterium]